MTAPLLTARGLSVARGRRTVVDGVDLTVAEGEVVVILGPNGAGKSTLLEAFGGVLPYDGHLTREGRVATVLQTPDLARRSVRANVEAALGWWGVPPRQRRARAEAALTRMRADHLARRPARALSGGERRRVHLARGLALAPDLLLLDEPFAGLDPSAREVLLADTTDALREGVRGAVVVLHVRQEAWALADRIVVLIDGRIAADAPPAALLSAPPSAEVARFVGYDGELRRGDTVTLTRTPHVLLGEGPLRAVVTGVRRGLDADRIALTLDSPEATGRVFAESSSGSSPRVGEEVAVRIVGGFDVSG